jgi:dihydroorotate dehydrogenase (fumarate)
MPLPLINPRLINSANPWCSTRADLQSLFNDESTGAVTTRTSLLESFPHDPTIHQFTFFSPVSSEYSEESKDFRDGHITGSHRGSLNTLGHSPYRLASYLSILGEIVATSTLPDSIRLNKPFIISVTGSVRINMSITPCFEQCTDYSR